jgi:hypothetical protein
MTADPLPCDYGCGYGNGSHPDCPVHPPSQGYWTRDDDGYGYFVPHRERKYEGDPYEEDGR